MTSQEIYGAYKAAEVDVDNDPEVIGQDIEGWLTDYAGITFENYLKIVNFYDHP